MKKNEIYCINGEDIRRMTRVLLEKADLVSLICGKTGGCDSKTAIAIKPNLVSPTPASFGATTHPEIIEELIVYLHENGFQNITIMEGSWVGDKTEESFRECGYETIAHRYNVKLTDTKKEISETVNCNGMELEICSCALQADFLINVPVLKGHCQTKMTCALKNIKGLIPDREKRRFHKLGLHDPIAHLNSGLHQDFILVDDICGDPDFEDGGNPQKSDRMLCSLDPVLIDAYACRELGWKPEEVPYVMKAEKLGIGQTEGAEIIQFGLDGEIITDVPGQGLSAAASKNGRRILDVSFAIEETNTCSACYNSLSEALWRLKEEGLLDKLDTKIGIGQGMEGKSGKLGVGRCTAKFEINVQGCPAEPDDIYEKLKEYILSKETT